LFVRGKGDYFRLGHGTDAHVRKPQLVEALKGKKIVHVSVGALHCLAVTDAGQVCSCISADIAVVLVLLMPLVVVVVVVVLVVVVVVVL